MKLVRTWLCTIVGLVAGIALGAYVASTTMPNHRENAFAFYVSLGLSIGWWVGLFRAASKK